MACLMAVRLVGASVAVVGGVVRSFEVSTRSTLTKRSMRSRKGPESFFW